jgi:hypothetical protein
MLLNSLFMTVPVNGFQTYVQLAMLKFGTPKCSPTKFARELRPPWQRALIENGGDSAS